MTDEHLVIVMEYASGGPLEERVATSGPLPEEDAKKFYRQLVDGMGYCHIQVPLVAFLWFLEGDDICIGNTGLAGLGWISVQQGQWN